MTERAKQGSLLHGRVDWLTIGIALVLTALGWVNLYAAVYDGAGAAFDFGSRYGMQLVWIGVSLAMSLVVMLVDDKYYHILAFPLYIGVLAVMVLTLFVSPEIKGARAWLVLGPVSIQPAEFMKFAASLALARTMSVFGFSLGRLRDFLRVAAILALPIAVMFLQHDVGSAVVYGSFLFMLYREGLNRWIYIVSGIVMTLFFGSFWITDTGLLMLIIAGCTVGAGLTFRSWQGPLVFLASVAFASVAAWLGFVFIGGMDWRYYHILLVTAGASLPVVMALAYARRLRGFGVFIALFIASVAFVSVTDVVFDSLDTHQQKRILDTLGIESDARGWGYNVNQSKIAIGSGGFTGKGWLEGTQTKFNFVPEQSTDFIFCTVGEEWGFVGTVVVLALFCVLIMRLVAMGERAQEPFSRIYCYCVAGVFLLHVLINVGMTIGLVPVIGIPLPFFSYGGSSFLAFTLLLVVAVRLDLGSGDLSQTRL
ncbi:MAG: rod shape-determining protein RodA [Alistipes sp.]|jgi:rod shape determining protein RodA|nr:rod shape-determining protein RodA [Alistipes sp.]